MSFHMAPTTRGNDRLGQEWTRACLFLPTVLCVCGEEAVPPTAGCLGRLGLGRAFCSACRKGWPPRKALPSPDVLSRLGSVLPTRLAYYQESCLWPCLPVSVRLKYPLCCFICNVCSEKETWSSVRPVAQGLWALGGTDQVHGRRDPNQQTLGSF